jgi:hypothetical protein
MEILEIVWQLQIAEKRGEKKRAYQNLDVRMCSCCLILDGKPFQTKD